MIIGNFFFFVNWKLLRKKCTFTCKSDSPAVVCLLLLLLFVFSVCLVIFNTNGSDNKESACNAGDLDSIPGSGRSPGE